MKIQLISLCLATALQSCSPCKAIEAQFPVLVTYVEEANQALSQVESAMTLAGALLPDKQREAVALALKEAHAGLQAASVGMRDGIAACQAKNVSETFQAFNAAWAVIKPLIPVILGAVGQKQVGYAGQGIKDPAVYAFKK
jgi:hypothetical protein